MRLALAATADRSRVENPAAISVRLACGDVYRVPRHIRHIRVVLGQAWVSFEGKDRLLFPGQQMVFAGTDIALVSSIDRAPLVFECSREMRGTWK